MIRIGLRRAREALRAYEGRLEVSYWSGQPLQQLLENLRKLPADAIVLYLAVSGDGCRTHLHACRSSETRLPRHQRLPFMEFWRLISDKGLSEVRFQASKLMES